MVQENGAQRPAPVRDMSAHAAAAPPDLNLKTRCKNIFKEIALSKKLNWVISFRFWIIPKKKLQEICFLDWSSSWVRVTRKNNVLY